VQRLRVIITVDADRSLSDDRTVVDLLVNEVHGYPRIGHTTFECLVDSVGTRKRWQQGRVHIDDRVREAGHGRWRQDPHESREHETRYPVGLCCVTHGSGEVVPGLGVRPPDDLCWDSCVARPGQGTDATPIRDDDSYRVCSIRMVHQRLEVASLTRDEDSERNGNREHQRAF